MALNYRFELVLYMVKAAKISQSRQNIKSHKRICTQIYKYEYTSVSQNRRNLIILHLFVLRQSHTCPNVKRQGVGLRRTDTVPE
jgi:hypothetical protein